MKRSEDIKQKVIELSNEGKILFMQSGSLYSVDVKEFIKQPADGILYDLNRSEVTTLAFIDDPKWINDYAVRKVIRSLKETIQELENKITKTK